jgi:ParB family chromosome partitioning protein
MNIQALSPVKPIPVANVSVLNPRVRNKRAFAELVQSIKAVGLKRPITVRRNGEDPSNYDLVCGQGRLEAFIELKQSLIPAAIIEATTEEALLKSLVENCARRQQLVDDIFRDIGAMKRRGYSDKDVAKKTGLSTPYVRGVCYLLRRRETRLLRAVEAEHMSVSLAVQIAKVDFKEGEKLFERACERRIIRGRKRMVVRRMLKARRLRGKGFRERSERALKAQKVPGAVAQAYREHTDQKRELIVKAVGIRRNLDFIANALREMSNDKKLVALLIAEKLDSVPTCLLVPN